MNFSVPIFSFSYWRNPITSELNHNAAFCRIQGIDNAVRLIGALGYAGMPTHSSNFIDFWAKTSLFLSISNFVQKTTNMNRSLKDSSFRTIVVWGKIQ